MVESYHTLGRRSCLRDEVGELQSEEEEVEEAARRTPSGGHQLKASRFGVIGVSTKESIVLVKMSKWSE